MMINIMFVSSSLYGLEFSNLTLMGQNGTTQTGIIHILNTGDSWLTIEESNNLIFFNELNEPQTFISTSQTLCNSPFIAPGGQCNLSVTVEIPPEQQQGKYEARARLNIITNTYANVTLFVINPPLIVEPFTCAKKVCYNQTACGNKLAAPKDEESPYSLAEDCGYGLFCSKGSCSEPDTSEGHCLAANKTWFNGTCCGDDYTELFAGGYIVDGNSYSYVEKCCDEVNPYIDKFGECSNTKKNTIVACGSCEECQNKLDDASIEIVFLKNDLRTYTNGEGNCCLPNPNPDIHSPIFCGLSFTSSKILDCNNKQIILNSTYNDSERINFNIPSFITSFNSGDYARDTDITIKRCIFNMPPTDYGSLTPDQTNNVFRVSDFLMNFQADSSYNYKKINIINNIFYIGDNVQALLEIGSGWASFTSYNISNNYFEFNNSFFNKDAFSLTSREDSFIENNRFRGDVISTSGNLIQFSSYFHTQPKIFIRNNSIDINRYEQGITSLYLSPNNNKSLIYISDNDFCGGLNSVGVFGQYNSDPSQPIYQTLSNFSNIGINNKCDLTENFNDNGNIYCSAPCSNIDPRGNVDTLNNQLFSGWICDVNKKGQPLELHIYEGKIDEGGTLLKKLTANINDSSVAFNCLGGINHRYSLDMSSIIPTHQNTIYIYSDKYDENGNLENNKYFINEVYIPYCGDGNKDDGEDEYTCFIDSPLKGWIAQTAGIFYTKNKQINFTKNNSVLKTSYSFDIKANTNYTLSVKINNPTACSAYVDLDDGNCLSADGWQLQHCFGSNNQDAEYSLLYPNTYRTINIPSSKHNSSDGYFKQVHLRLVVDSCPTQEDLNKLASQGILFDDISLKESQYIVDKVYYDNLSDNIDSTSGCCPADWCWDGDKCVNSLLWMNDSQKATIWNLLDISNTDVWPNEHIYTNNQSITRGYRCVLNETDEADWVLSTIKYDWNYETSGYCPRETDCFVNKDLNQLDVEGTSGDDCIKDGESINDDFSINGGNHFCYQGNWTTKSYIIATELEQLTEGEEFVLLCDDDVKNTFNEADTGYISSACTLIKQDDAVITGFALRDENDFNSLITALTSQYETYFGTEQTITIPTSINDYYEEVDGGYYKYFELENLYVYYNPEGKYFLLSNKNIALIDPTAWQEFWTTISNFFKGIFGIQDNKDYDYINSVSTYDKIYLMNSTIEGQRVFVKGTQENKYDEYSETNKYFMYVRYDNTINNTINIDYLNEKINNADGYLNYTNSSAYQQILIISPETYQLWPYLTGMLRDR